MKIALVDCGSGNLASAARALACAAGRIGVHAEITISADPADVQQADRIVLPGQGAFATCARGIHAVPGLYQALMGAFEAGTPSLGICVGMQLMARRGLEHGVTSGFGRIRGDIAPLAASGLRLPHMGWNELEFTAGAHRLLDGLGPGTHMYFVHSYGLSEYDIVDVIAMTQYGSAVPAMIAHRNLAGTQFHVEKSQEAGLRILANFLAWEPAPGTARA